MFKASGAGQANPTRKGMSGSYFDTGRWLYALALLAIGFTLIIIRGFLVGLLPVSNDLPHREILALATGGLLIISALMLLVKKYSMYGAYLAAAIWMVLLVLIHLPKLLPDIHNGGEWTGTFEVIALLSGGLMLAGNRLMLAGCYVFAITLVVFGVQHWLYAAYIVSVIPTWMPAHLFWAYFVMVAFFAVAISIFIKKWIVLANGLLSLMFMLWVLLLHLPRVVSKPVEPEWTSMFIALAMSGMALLVAGRYAGDRHT